MDPPLPRFPHRYGSVSVGFALDEPTSGNGNSPRSYRVIEQPDPHAESRRGRNRSSFLRSIDRDALKASQLPRLFPSGREEGEEKKRNRDPRARHLASLEHFYCATFQPTMAGEASVTRGARGRTRDAGFLGSADGKKRSRPEVEVEVEIEAMRA